jgi:hypothetical protein
VDLGYGDVEYMTGEGLPPKRVAPLDSDREGEKLAAKDWRAMGMKWALLGSNQ